MAVQAQYPSNILLFNRNVQDGKNIPGGGGGFLDQSHTLINDNQVEVNNSRKRTREVASTTPNTTRPHNMNINTFDFSLQNHNQNQLIDITKLQSRHQQQHQTNVVSTGLGLSFGDQNKHQQLGQHHLHQQPVLQRQSSSSSSSLFSIVPEDFAFQLKQQSDQLNYFLHAQGEQLKRSLAEKRQRHYRALLSAAEEAVTKRLKEKEREVEKAAIRNAELESKWAQLNAEAQSWLVQAQAQEAQAATLQAQINHAMTTNSAQQQDRKRTGLTCAGGAGDVEDCESAYVDPVSERRVDSTPSCKVCRTRGASVVILPCRHLCVCTGCDEVVQACPLCLATRSASLEVYLS